MVKNIKKRSLGLRKTKDSLSGLYSTLISEANMIAKNSQREVTEDDFTVVIKKIIKNNNDFISKLDETNQDKIDILVKENTELGQWLPKMLTKDELIQIITELNPSNIGQAMGYLKQNYMNQYDGKMASEVIRGLI